MFHVVIACEYLICTLSCKYHRYIIGGALAGEVAWNGTAYEGGIIAFKFINNHWQCIIVFLLGKDQFMVIRSDVLSRDAGSLKIVTLFTKFIFHAHHKGMEVWNFFGSNGSNQAAVQAATAEGTYMDFLV